jgi:hypothetical protein
MFTFDSTSQIALFVLIMVIPFLFGATTCILLAANAAGYKWAERIAPTPYNLSVRWNLDGKIINLMKLPFQILGAWWIARRDRKIDEGVSAIVKAGKHRNMRAHA